MEREPLPRHDERDDATGRFAESSPCEACGKPAGTDYMSDPETLAVSARGLVLCDRARCVAHRDSLDMAGRLSLYTAPATTAPAGEYPVAVVAQWRGVARVQTSAGRTIKVPCKGVRAHLAILALAAAVLAGE